MWMMIVVPVLALFDWQPIKTLEIKASKESQPPFSQPSTGLHVLRMVLLLSGSESGPDGPGEPMSHDGTQPNGRVR